MPMPPTPAAKSFNCRQMGSARSQVGADVAARAGGGARGAQF
jgi:hypothetical protein